MGVVVHAALPVGEPPPQAGVVGGDRLLRDVDRSTEVGGDPLPVPGALVDVQDKLAEVDALALHRETVDIASLAHEVAASDARLWVSPVKTPAAP